MTSFPLCFVLINWFFKVYSFCVSFLVFYVLLCNKCVLCFLFCVLFLPIYIDVYFVYLYTFTDHCHRVGTQLQLISYRIVSYHIMSYHIISYHIISYHIISYHTSYRIVSYRIVSYHIIYHIISYRIVSYPTVSYHIVYHIIYHIFLLEMRHSVYDVSARNFAKRNVVVPQTKAKGV